MVSLRLIFQAPNLCLCLSTIFFFHIATSNPTGFSLNLIPRDSPVSPLYPGNLTNLQRIERLIKFSNARGYYLENFSNPNATTTPEPDNIRFTLLRDNFFYMVQVGIGSQQIPEFLLMDTGGGLIWTQCLPCTNCYNQHFPIYNSQASTSYRKLPCDHPLCSGPQPLYQCVNNECRYQYSYGGGASTAGVASIETFKFTISPVEAKLFDGIIFGCSNDNRNVQFAKNGVISGIFGLSKSPDSLVSQLWDSIDRKFSYCLVPFDQAIQAPSVLRFGEDIPILPGNLQTTKFVTPPGSYYYYLHLLDISVGLTRIGFAPEIFQIRPDGQGGCVIDSGALISRIDQTTIGRNAYRAVMGAFQRYYDAKGLQRIGQVPQGFALCYKNRPDFNDFVTMTYHFEGANYVLDGKYVHYFDNDAGYFCVALTPGNGRTILGAWHQQNMRIVYDGNIGALQFTTEDCTKDASS
ncbi:hypothetical protein Tsubulata_026023 [Turnera subulata]|uniref:Peptidase A1 domain-containing protein n=1 Tax=Turnera subulata TaxID=218843 RepID=A0A9Q0JEI5_9ROSI|nr:hypothetical protein Tsubulata_026023 [Turnera subulata]